ncbi:MAG: hypothetical protein U1E38_00805 [Rhodospirillales bacterium]
MPHLPSVGLCAVSTLGARATAVPTPGVRQTNVHVDLIDWQGTGGFRGDGLVLDQILAHLRARRSGQADRDEPTGVMSHHSFHDSRVLGVPDRALCHPRSPGGALACSAREAFRR